MSTEYLRTIVRSGSRPIASARGRDRRVQPNSAALAERTMNNLFPLRETQHGMPAPDVPETVRAAGTDAASDQGNSVSEAGLAAEQPADPEKQREHSRQTDNGRIDSTAVSTIAVQEVSRGTATTEKKERQEQPERAGEPDRLPPQRTGLASVETRQGAPLPLPDGTAKTERSRADEHSGRSDLAVFSVTPHGSSKNSDAPAAGRRTPSPEQAGNPGAEVAVFYATPRAAAQHSAMMTVDAVEPDKAAAPRPHLSPTASSRVQQQAQPALPTSTPGAAAPDGTPDGAVNGKSASLSVQAPAANRRNALIVPAREATPAPASGESELPAPRPREQAHERSTAGALSRSFERGPKLMIHRLDVQIVTQKQPEPPRPALQPERPAAAQEAWEGTDRHYLHRASLSI